MAKVTFKNYTQQERFLFPMNFDERIPQNSSVRLVDAIVNELDITSILKSYKGGGTSSYHPRMMLKILFFAYMNNIYSCRRIEKELNQNIHYIWLSGDQHPDFRTINHFRSHRLKAKIHGLFTQVVLLLCDQGYISLDKIYVDGTKIESFANRYTFVWRGSIEKNKVKLEEKIRSILADIDEGIAQDNTDESTTFPPLNSQELKERISKINEENKSKEEKKKIKTLKEKHLPKLQEYENKLSTMREDRNSYSKTDPDATFMRMKEDKMGNGQLKPAYNVQIGTENQFITAVGFTSDRNDTFTLKDTLESTLLDYGKMPQEVIADAGYGSEENYTYMYDNGLTPFVKYNYFHKEQTSSFKNNTFIQDNLHYNAKEDYFVCPMGQHMTACGISHGVSKSGYVSNLTKYRATNCKACPLRGLCYKVPIDRRVIEVNHNLRELKKEIRVNLTSPKGLYHRSKRPVEPEPIFGQTKYNKQYNRFRHKGMDKIAMDFEILMIAINLSKMHKKGGFIKNTPDNCPEKSHVQIFIVSCFNFRFQAA